MSLMSWIVLVWMGLGSSAACYLYILHVYSAVNVNCILLLAVSQN